MLVVAMGCTASRESEKRGREVAVHDARSLHGDTVGGSIWLQREVGTTEAEVFLQRELGEYWSKDSEIHALWMRLRSERAPADRLWIYSEEAVGRWASKGGRGLALERAGEVIMILPVTSMYR